MTSGREGRGDQRLSPSSCEADGKPAGAAPTKPCFRAGSGGGARLHHQLLQKKLKQAWILFSLNDTCNLNIPFVRAFFLLFLIKPTASESQTGCVSKDTDRCSEDGMFCAQRHFYREKHTLTPGDCLIMDKETGCVHQPRGPHRSAH